MASESETDEWLVDYGASSHMSNCKEEMANYSVLEKPLEIHIADGTILKAEGKGEVKIKLSNGNAVIICDVLFLPGIERKLISITQDWLRLYKCITRAHS